MSHNLVITNNKDSEYVEFEVNIPDGYNTFKLEYLNGSIINQNYLKVGDVIRFKFDNNPVRYNVPKAKLQMKFNDNTRMDNMSYDYIDVDMFTVHQLIFIPVYQYYDQINDQINYIFNPCDNSMLFDQPISRVEPVVINRDNNGNESYVDFTGCYIMGFKAVSNNKIPDQTITIGESISNTRTRPQDMGAFQLSNNIVNEVPINSVTTRTYNYGSVWQYVVSNECLKHVETTELILPTRPGHETNDVVFAISYNVDDEQYAGIDSGVSLPVLGSTIQASTGVISGSSYVMYANDISGTNPQPLDNDVTLLGPVLQDMRLGTVNPFIIQLDNSNNPKNILNQFNIKGSTLGSNRIATIHGIGTLDDPIQYALVDSSVVNQIVDGWNYSGFHLRFQLWTTDKPRAGHTLANFTIQTTNNIGVGYYQFNKHKHINRNGQEFYLRFNNTGRNTDFYTNGSLPDNFGVYLCDGTTSDDQGWIDVYYALNVGLSTPITISSSEVVSGHYSESILEAAGNDKVYVTKVDNGIRLSTNNMKNLTHTITVTLDEHQNPSYSSVVSESKWNNTKDLLAFVPLKTKRWLRELNYGSEREGWFIISDMNGYPSRNMSSSTCEVYLATGHDTLNVEPPNEDDYKFKTFNGTLVFDRSNTKITRLFSNDLTGACLGYLNDILAARLSRYYFVSNYGVWNSFLNTNSTLSFTRDISFLRNIYRSYEYYTGTHEIWMSSCQDLVKLIGSENVVNNCMPSLYPEEQHFDCTVMTNSRFKDDPIQWNDPSTIYYKTMCYYTPGLMCYPYVGTDINDMADGSTTVGGINLMLDTSNSILMSDVDTRVMDRPIYVINDVIANSNRSRIYDLMTDNQYYYSNNHKNIGCIETLPLFRIYRNSNFEQNDLTITTGGIKLLHPIYLQSTPRMLINNICYILDCVIEGMMNQYGSIVNDDDTIGFISVRIPINDDGRTTVDDGVAYDMVRYGISNGVASSLDSFCLLNYIHMNAINTYQNMKELTSSLPTKDNRFNEELISSVETNTILTNVQLFSSKYFNFYDHVSPLSMIVFNSEYVEYVPVNADIIRLYYNIGSTVQEQSKNIALITDQVQGYINNTQSYNGVKLCKAFITKLGEFLDFPRIIYMGCESFNNTMNISVWNYNMRKYMESADHPEQKVNTYLYGVMFRYHQLAHGYQNFPNEMSNEYVISKALGNRTFTITLYDEFGRKIPNVDTNQGFRNNLYVELVLK